MIAAHPAAVPTPLELIVGEHPQPAEGSMRAGQTALDVSRSVEPGDLLLVLLSGGASSLMAAPVAPLTLDDKRLTTGLLLRGGADIHALNTVRKHLSAVKGGQLAAASKARCLTLVVSDVVGDDASVIASGPTVPDPSTFADAFGVLERHGGLSRFPPAVVSRLTRGVRGEIVDTPKPGDRRLARATVQVIGNRAIAMRGAIQAALDLGFHVETIGEAIVGEARFAAVDYLERVRRLLEHTPRPCCVVSSGETTVTVRGDGRGGRNQEFALACAGGLAGLASAAALASVGTDGIDGPTDAAGAIVDPTSLRRGRTMGLDPDAVLSLNNSYDYFASLGDLIQIGPTGTNVGDLQVFLLA